MNLNKKQTKKRLSLILSLLLIISSVNGSLALKLKSTKVKTNGKKIVKTIKRKDKTSKVKVKSNPSITVTTKFPTETLSDSAIDIKYTATPSKGASIKEVTYTINDNFTEYLYYASENENERKGTLGKGRVLLQPGQNKIVFTVTDTAGKIGKYIVKQQPTFAEGTYAPDIKDDELTPFPDGSGYKFANNRLSLDVKDGTTKEQIEEIARYVNGEVIEHLFISGMVTIKIPKNSLEGLKAICSDIKKKYPNIIEYADIERFGNIGFD